MLNAGQGKRLLPLTASQPKCLLPVAGQRIIDWQLQELAACGVRKVTVVVGFAASKVQEALAQACARPSQIDTVHNPFFHVADNLVSCWVARQAMHDDFILLNGDTLFEAAVLRQLLASEPAPITVAIGRKGAYDADDMKVRCDGRTLLGIGKDLPPQETHGESIGMLIFRGAGPGLFREALEAAVMEPGARRLWYLSVINDLAQRGHVQAVSVDAQQWMEIDFPQDLRKAHEFVARWQIMERQ